MKAELEQMVDTPAVGRNGFIPSRGIEIPSPKMYDELQRRREYAGMTLDACLGNSKYKVEEVMPQPDNSIIGSFNPSFYLIRDKKGDIVGEVKYESGRKPFTVTSYNKCFDEEAKKLQTVLNDYNRPVYKLPMPITRTATGPHPSCLWR